MAPDTVISFFCDMLFMTFRRRPGLALMTAAADTRFHAGGLLGMTAAAGDLLAMPVVHGFPACTFSLMAKSA